MDKELDFTTYFQQVKDQIKKGFEDLPKQLRDTTGQLMVEMSLRNTELAQTFGRTQAAVVGLRKEFISSIPVITALGGSFQDAFNIQQKVSEAFNTNKILTAELASNLFTAGKALGIASTEMGSVVLDFENAGIQSTIIRDRMQQTANIARVVGANTNAVFTQVQQNLGNLNKFGFKDGVEGLSRMAAKAVSLRTDMFEIFNFAERVFSPEGAIEAVAGFQRMGVAVGDLADPFRLLYLAQEDVEGLYDGLTKMTAQFTYLDKQTGEVKLFSNAKRDLRDIAQITGQSVESLQKNALAMGKLNALGSEFKIMNVTEEDKLLIANLAEFNKKSGAYTVKLQGTEKLVSQLSSKDIEYLRGRPETLEEIAQAQLTEDELIRAGIESMVTLLGGIVPGSKPAGDLQQLIRATIEAGNTATLRAGTRLKPVIEKVDENYQNLPKILNQFYSEIQNGTFNFESAFKKIEEVSTNYSNGLKNLGTQIQSFDFIGEVKQRMSNDNLFGSGAGFLVDITNKFITEIEDGIFEPIKSSIEKAETNLNSVNTQNVNSNLANLSSSTSQASTSLFSFGTMLNKMMENLNNPKAQTTSNLGTFNQNNTTQLTGVNIAQINNQLSTLVAFQTNQLKSSIQSTLQRPKLNEIEPPNTNQISVEQQNQNVVFSPIRGNIDLKVVTEDGTKVDLTNQIVSSAEFQRRVVALITERMQGSQYSNVQNSAEV
jgi:urease gamma subunit